jgi:hypothetical protein
MGKFVAADPATNDVLGRSIAIENNIVVVGASQDNSASGIFNTGSVYVLDIEFLSSTATPSTEQTPIATPEPTLSPTPKPTNPPTTMTPSPVIDDTSPPLPMKNAPTSKVTVPSPTPPPSSTSTPTANKNIAMIRTNDDDSKTVLSPGVIVGVSAIVVVGGVAALIAILNYRIKLQRDARAQQEQQTLNTGNDAILSQPPPVSASNTPADANFAADEIVAPVMVDVVVMPLAQAVQDRTMEADAFLDPTTISAVQTDAAGIAILARKEFPMYKDQVRNVEPP